MSQSQFGSSVYEFSVERQLYVGEQDDVSGYIYLPGYFHFMSMGDQDMLAALGHPMWAQIDEGLSVPVVHTACDYKRPLRVGTRFVDRMNLHLGQKSSFRVTHVFEGTTGEIYATGVVVRCWVDMKTFSRAQMPDWFRELEKVSPTHSRP
jgi:YbgC/YbaW family acyl-CoA thioester hydrolase